MDTQTAATIQANAAIVQAAAAGLTLVVTIVLALITRSYADTSKKQHQEMVKTRLSEFEPFVAAAAVCPWEEGSFRQQFMPPAKGLTLSLKNMWTGPALRISALIESGNGVAGEAPPSVDLGGREQVEDFHLRFTAYPTIDRGQQNSLISVDAVLALNYRDMLQREWRTQMPLVLGFVLYAISDTPYCQEVKIAGPAKHFEVTA